jgi:hypothetical protein
VNPLDPPRRRLPHGEQGRRPRAPALPRLRPAGGLPAGVRDEVAGWDGGRERGGMGGEVACRRINRDGRGRRVGLGVGS